MSLGTEVLLSKSVGSLVRSILLVEDEDAIRMLLAEYFEDSGYHVLEAGTVAEAKCILANTAVDVVFSDINMPGKETGFDLEKWIHQLYPETRVLLTSGAPQVAADTRDLREPLIAKPYKCSAVLKCVEQIPHLDHRFGRSKRPASATTEAASYQIDGCSHGAPAIVWPTARYAK